VKRKNSATAIIATEKTFSITHFFNSHRPFHSVRISDWPSGVSEHNGDFAAVEDLELINRSPGLAFLGARVTGPSRKITLERAK